MPNVMDRPPRRAIKYAPLRDRWLELDRLSTRLGYHSLGKLIDDAIDIALPLLQRRAAEEDEPH